MEQSTLFAYYEEWIDLYYPSITYSMDADEIRVVSAAYCAGYMKRVLEETKIRVDNPRENRSLSSLFRRG